MSRFPNVPPLRAQDADLPILAARAAIEIDNVRLNKPVELNAVKALSMRLANTFEKNGGDKNRAVLDSSTAAIVTRAFGSAAWPHAVTSTDQLLRETRALAKKMDQLTPDPKQQGLETLRNFFVALSRCATAYRQSIHDQIPVHPFRR
jgi:predicted PP-loop superfamily ATPase